jgi:hypothetical protein
VDFEDCDMLSQCFIIDDMEPPAHPQPASISDAIPPSRQALAEALTLSAEVLRNVELSELPLANVALKASRLARLLNEFDVQKIMEYEAGGYPSTSGGVPPDVWRLAAAAGRNFEFVNPSTKQTQTYIYPESISQLEE